MRRPVLWCVLSFLLGAFLAWRYLSTHRPPVDMAPPPIPTPRPAADAEPEVTRVSGTLDDVLGGTPAGPDGTAPSDEYTVKGAHGVFHTTASPDYPLVTATVWFKTATDAEHAGFRHWQEPA